MDPPDGSLDPTNTIINGNYPTTINRCFLLNNYGAWLKGLTITNGCQTNEDAGLYSGGGGVRISTGHLTNCIITGNRYYGTVDGSSKGGAGLYLTSSSGTVWNCTISYNTCYTSGGGIKVFAGGPWLIANSTIAGNVCSNRGAGISIYDLNNKTEFRDCQIVSNSPSSTNGYGGGVEISYYCDLVRCVISGNSVSSNSYGAGAYISGGTLRNCVIANNYIASGGTSYGGGIYLQGQDATYRGLIQNCTIYSNAAGAGGGMYWNHHWQALCTNFAVENSIIWANFSHLGTSSNYARSSVPNCKYSFTNCCLAPDPGESSTSFRTNCVFSDPLFAGLAVNNVNLQSGSPCINAGINRTWMDGAKDMAGRSRIDHFSRQVDMGAYEFLPKGTLLGGH